MYLIGIEYGMIRRLKLLEEEREVLQKGLQAVERARDWYLRQVGNVQDKLQATSHGYANPVSVKRLHTYVGIKEIFMKILMNCSRFVEIMNLKC